MFIDQKYPETSRGLQSCLPLQEPLVTVPQVLHWEHMPCTFTANHQRDHQDQEEDGAQAGEVQHVLQQVQQLAKLRQQRLDDQILG